jgi:non-homologous end joining protein Ku
MTTALAPSPSRATTSVTLSWGLVTIPLSVFTGVEETRVKRSEFFQGDPNVQVGRTAIRKDTNEVVSNDDVVRMAQAESGAWVALTDDEIAACTSPRGLAEIVSFVPVRKMSSYLVQDVKQVRPKKEKGKSNPAADKAFALLLSAMKTRKVVALVQVALRGPARYALLDHEGNMYLVATADQVRGAQPLPTATLSDAERQMADALIDAVGIDAPVLMDTTAPVVQAYVNDKAVGVSAPVPVPVASPNVDIMAQLMASIDAAKAGKS